LQLTNKELKEKINEYKKKLSVTVVAHFYQRDEVFEVGDITGDSLELAIKTRDDNSEFVVFCGVGFMGQSVKVLSPNKRVAMPKAACCAMAVMIDGMQFDASVKALNEAGIMNENILPITYINSNADVKAKVGRDGRYGLYKLKCKKNHHDSLKRGEKDTFCSR